VVQCAVGASYAHPEYARGTLVTAHSQRESVPDGWLSPGFPALIMTPCRCLPAGAETPPPPPLG